jgi:hypothetical protein
MGDRIARIERDGSQEFSLSAWKHHASIVSKRGRRTRTPWKVNPAKRPRLLVVPILRRIALCRVGGDCDVTFAPSCGLLQQSRARGSLAGVNLDSGDRKPLQLALDRLFGLLSFSEQQEFLEARGHNS